jgi:hypothetical protein
LHVVKYFILCILIDLKKVSVRERSTRVGLKVAYPNLWVVGDVTKPKSHMDHISRGGHVLVHHSLGEEAIWEEGVVQHKICQSSKSGENPNRWVKSTHGRKLVTSKKENFRGKA